MKVLMSALRALHGFLLFRDLASAGWTKPCMGRKILMTIRALRNNKQMVPACLTELCVLRHR
ncbi:MAG: hypothetical protein H6Q52_1972, partial [Deltaproteobacteria bacterium]|nr:hypothetical protein [Deltaproteobacteria bacterium]